MKRTESINLNKDIWEKNWCEIAEYSAKSAGNLWAFYLINVVLKDIIISKDGCVVDAGCGMGNKSSELAKLFAHNKVYGVDFAQKGIDFASEYYSEITNLEFKYGDVRELNNSINENVEMITAFELIEHVEDWEQLLLDFCDLTKKYILISTPTGRMRGYEKNIGHYRNFKKGEIEEFLSKKGFKKVKVLYAGFPFWSPITRDITDLRTKFIKRSNSETNELILSYNPLVHNITYFLYRYLSFNNIGDQFMGLFEKEYKN